MATNPDFRFELIVLFCSEDSKMGRGFESQTLCVPQRGGVGEPSHDRLDLIIRFKS